VRRKILAVAMGVAALAVALFGLPLGVAVYNVFYNDEHRELDRAALRVALRASATLPDAAAAVQANGSDDVRTAVYGPDGRRIAGHGPEVADAPVRDALAGQIVDTHVGGDLVAAVPVYDGSRVVAVARAASERSALQLQVLGVWGAMAGLAALAGGVSYVLAARQARRLADPLVQLELAAEELGGGNFAVRAEPCGVTEIDRAGAALNRTAERLDELLARERTFTAVASHQLRTPLTAMRLSLEQALEGPDDALRGVVAEAISDGDRLSGTIDDVLALARGGPRPGPLLLPELITHLAPQWGRALGVRGRHLEVVAEEAPPALASPAAVRQILTVLIDNATQHGQGTVTVRIRNSSDAVAVDVVDEGSAAQPLVPGPGFAGPRRLGLAIASSLAEAEGGRLVHARTEPTTRLTLLLPAATDAVGLPARPESDT
jgi:signal transduction histidine kinase